MGDEDLQTIKLSQNLVLPLGNSLLTNDELKLCEATAGIFSLLMIIICSFVSFISKSYSWCFLCSNKTIREILLTSPPNFCLFSYLKKHKSRVKTRV